jgi:predicted helicase
LKRDIEKGIVHDFNKSEIIKSVYRPFLRQILYFDKSLIERPGINLRLFPNSNSENVSICISPSPNDGLSVLIANTISDHHFNGDTQCFPLYYFDENQNQNRTLFDADGESNYVRRDGISDFIIGRARKQYGFNVTKEDIFYYVYGFLHSREYRDVFRNDLKKMLPRMPLVEDVRDFWVFNKSGHMLADLHLNYETVSGYKSVKVTGIDSNFFTVEKMRFPKKDQKDTIYYNSKITISNIPAKAYEFIVNGKSAIEWIMERYAVTRDPNEWANESGNPRYILDLILSIINVSVQTVEIVEKLPRLKFA